MDPKLVGFLIIVAVIAVLVLRFRAFMMSARRSTVANRLLAAFDEIKWDLEGLVDDLESLEEESPLRGRDLELVRDLRDEIKFTLNELESSTRGEDSGWIQNLPDIGEALHTTFRLCRYHLNRRTTRLICELSEERRSVSWDSGMNATSKGAGE